MTSETNEFVLMAVVKDLAGTPLYLGYTNKTNLEGWALSKKIYEPRIDNTSVVDVICVVPREIASEERKRLRKIWRLD